MFDACQSLHTETLHLILPGIFADFRLSSIRQVRNHPTAFPSRIELAQARRKRSVMGNTKPPIPSARARREHRSLRQMSHGSWTGSSCVVWDVITDSLSIRGRHLSYQRSRHTVHPQTSLIKIEGVDDTNAAKYVFTPNQSQAPPLRFLLFGC